MMSNRCRQARQSNSQRVQIRQQIIDLLLIKNLGEAWHLVASQANYIGDPVIIRRHATHRQILPLENAFHAGPLPSARRVGFMTPVAIIVVNLASGDLLWIESEFGIALAALNIAAGQQANRTKTQSKQFRISNFAISIDKNARPLHLSVRTQKQTATIIKQSACPARESSDYKTSQRKTSVRKTGPRRWDARSGGPPLAARPQQSSRGGRQVA